MGTAYVIEFDKDLIAQENNTAESNRNYILDVNKCF
jgi:hypothetical protein